MSSTSICSCGSCSEHVPPNMFSIRCLGVDCGGSWYHGRCLDEKEQTYIRDYNKSWLELQIVCSWALSRTLNHIRTETRSGRQAKGRVWMVRASYLGSKGSGFDSNPRMLPPLPSPGNWHFPACPCELGRQKNGDSVIIHKKVILSPS